MLKGLFKVISGTLFMKNTKNPQQNLNTLADVVHALPSVEPSPQRISAAQRLAALKRSKAAAKNISAPAPLHTATCDQNQEEQATPLSKGKKPQDATQRRASFKPPLSIDKFLHNQFPIPVDPAVIDQEKQARQAQAEKARQAQAEQAQLQAIARRYAAERQQARRKKDKQKAARVAQTTAQRAPTPAELQAAAEKEARLAEKRAEARNFARTLSGPWSVNASDVNQLLALPHRPGFQITIGFYKMRYLKIAQPPIPASQPQQQPEANGRPPRPATNKR